MRLRDVLIVSASEEDLRRIEDQLRDDTELRLRSIRLSEALNGNLRRAFTDADLAVVCCRNGQTAVLETIDALPGAHRPRILVCGELHSPEATRLMVRIGAVDLLPSTPTTLALQAAVKHALRDLRIDEKPPRQSRIISVFGASGEAANAFVALNLAHLVAEAGKETMLIDLDLTYAPLPTMLGLRATRGLVEAMAQLESLDPVALEGYTARHESGLRVLAALPEGGLPRPISAKDFARLLELARERHDFLVIAANGWFDAASIEAATASHHVLLVLGQSLADVRIAVRLRQLLTQSIGVPESVVRIVLNRYSTRLPVQDEMISKALGAPPIVKIPYDAPLIRRSIDSGTPVASLDRHSSVTAALIDLETRLTGLQTPAHSGPIRRMLASLARGER